MLHQQCTTRCGRLNVRRGAPHGKYYQCMLTCCFECAQRRCRGSRACSLPTCVLVRVSCCLPRFPRRSCLLSVRRVQQPCPRGCVREGPEDHQLGPRVRLSLCIVGLQCLLYCSSGDSAGASAASQKSLYDQTISRRPSTILALQHETYRAHLLYPFCLLAADLVSRI